MICLEDYLVNINLNITIVRPMLSEGVSAAPPAVSIHAEADVLCM